MRYLLCDDDVHLRSVLTTLLANHGHEVVAEADTSLEALELSARADPEVLIVDLALRFGSGRDVVEEASAQGRRVIVFSAFTERTSFPGHPGVIVVPKPDFAGLEAAISMVAARTPDARAGGNDRDRREAWTPDREVPARPLDDASSFYEALAAAQPGDVLIVIQVDTEHDGQMVELGHIVRGVVRAQDRVMVRDGQLEMLLIAGGTAAAVRVAARIERACFRSSERFGEARYVAIVEGEAPADAFARLRTAPESFVIS